MSSWLVEKVYSEKHCSTQKNTIWSHQSAVHDLDTVICRPFNARRKRLVSVALLVLELWDAGLGKRPIVKNA